MLQPAASILLVDDDETIREVVAEILREEGYGVRCAAHGLEALHVMQSEGKPKVVLLDLMMPVMDGWTLLEAIRRDSSLTGVPVVVMTAGGDRARQLCEALDVVAYFEKPIRLDELLGVVAQYCASPPFLTNN